MLFFNSIDVFCLPSLHEPFGIVLLESFAHQIPVVTSASEGPSQIVTDQYDALVFEAGNPKDLALALERLLVEPALAKKIASHGRETFAKNYDIKVVSEKIESALIGIVGDY